MIVTLFAALSLAIEYPERKEASKSSIDYFDSFEDSRKGSNSKSIFGLKIDPKIGGIKEIV